MLPATPRHVPRFLLASLALFLAACSSDVGAGIRRVPARAVPAAYTDAGLRFDRGTVC